MADDETAGSSGLAKRDGKNSGRRGAAPAQSMMAIRTLHFYLGMFIAPSVLFFSFSGALQLFSLHEAHGAYQPPALIEKLGELHKNQRFGLKPKRPAKPGGAEAGHVKGADAMAKRAGHAEADADHDDHDHDHAAPAAGAAPQAKVTPFNVTAMKWLFLGVAVSLFLSTLLGVWMGLTHARRKGVGWMLLAAGIVLPVVLAIL